MDDENEIKHDYSLDKIFTNELGGLLGYSTQTSVNKWCVKNNVEIYKYGKRRYILRYDYNRVIQEPQIKNFKTKYGENWETAFELAKNNELYKMNIQVEPISIHHQKGYAPKSIGALKILKSK